MSERQFRLIIGTTLLVSLYFDLKGVMVALIGLLVFEGVTNLRIPVLISRWRYGPAATIQDGGELAMEPAVPRIHFDAERAWRLVVSAMLVLSYLTYYDQLWFFPWFMGFAIFGAGLSGVCPVLISLKLIGFR